MNHALNADYLHTRERLGLDRGGRDAEAARSHARQAGREAALRGVALGKASGHVGRFEPLSHAYAQGFAEAEHALISGSDKAFLGECLAARGALDKAIHECDIDDVYDAMQSIFSTAADNPGLSLPFFSDTPEVAGLIEAADRWRRARQELDAAAVRRAEWETSLPTAAELKGQLEAAEREGREAFDFEGYTLWHEPDHGGWSLTNAYGVDNCAFLASEGHLQRLLDAVRKGEEFGPVPPGCDAQDDDHPDSDASGACVASACSLIRRLNLRAFGLAEREPR